MLNAIVKSRLRALLGPRVSRALKQSLQQARFLPFPDKTFHVVYARHILEHSPWHQVPDTLKEWRRVLKRGGALQVWTPDRLKISKASVGPEERGSMRGVARSLPLSDSWFGTRSAIITAR